MANGSTRILLADMARPKTPKGSALKNALGAMFSPKRIASVTGKEKQPKK